MPFHSSHLENGIKVSQYGYKGYCPDCEIPLKRFTKTKFNDTEWYSTDVKLEMVINEVSKVQSNLINSRLEKYKTKKRKWKDFVKHKRQDDKLVLFENKSESTFGILITRVDKPLLDFQLSEYLYKLVKGTKENSL